MVVTTNVIVFRKRKKKKKCALVQKCKQTIQNTHKINVSRDVFFFRCVFWKKKNSSLDCNVP